MKKFTNILVTFLLSFVFTIANAQLNQIDLPISWDDPSTDYTVADFGGNVSSVVTDPAGLVNNVLQSEKTVGAASWAGTTLGTASGFATAIPFSSGATTMTAHVYAASAGVTIKLKAEDSNDPTKSVETDVVTTTSGAWESLTFDFANQSAGTAQIDFTYTYDKLSIFYDFGNVGAGDFYYLDSVMFNSPVTTSHVDLFFSEYAEGSSNNKYFEIYNPTADTVDLSQYAYPSTANAPNTIGVYEWWNDFDAGAVILPYDVYVVAHPSADASIIAHADETHTYLSNGDDGYALVFGSEPPSPTDPATGGYTVLDWLGDWNGDPGSGWDVAGVSNATKDHTLVRKCAVTTGNTDWTASAGTDASNSEWIVYPNETWTYLGSHINPCSQIDLPVTWDDVYTDNSVTDFGGNSSSITADTSLGNILTTEKTAGAQTWAGTTLGTASGFATAIPFASGATTMTAHVYTNMPVGTPIRLKAEDSNDPTKSVETQVSTTATGAWEAIVFDFDNEVSGTAAIDFTYTYDKLSIFYDFGNAGAGDFYYLDSVMFGGVVAGTPGCTDPLASNYDASATLDDGSCVYAVTFNVDMNCEPAGSFTTPNLESPVFGWCGGCVPLTDADGDGVWSVTLDLPLGNFEYKYAHDSWLGQEDLVDDMLAGGTCAPVTDYASYANRLVTVVAGLTTSDTYGSCDPCALGCTDINACNYDALATTDDGSCASTSYTLTMVDSYGDGWNGNTFDVIDANGTVVSSSTLASGATGTDVICIPDACYDFTCGGGSWAYEVSWTLTDDATGIVVLSGGAPYGPTSLCLPPVYGCTDSNACNYDASATVDDGSCASTTFTLTMNDSYGDGWNGNTFDVTDANGTVVSSSTLASGSTGTDVICIPDACYDITCGGGSWGSEVSWTLTDDATGTVILSGGAPYGPTSLCIPVVLGCTDSLATNYDPAANLDDGSCSYVACGAPAPTHETFSTGVLPVGYCTPNQWEISATVGDGWRFTGNPGYNASTSAGNDRVSGEFAWIDFSSDDVDPILEVEHVDVSTLTSPYVWFDYFSDLGTYTCAANNLMHVEAFDGTSWNLIVTMDLNVPGWNTYNYSLAGFENGSMVEIRFRGESSGLSCDYFNDLLLDDVRIMEAPTYGCTNPAFDNYDPAANIDDGSCINSYTLYMYDSYGDGWNGNTWNATSTSSGTVYGPYTVSSAEGDSSIATFTSAELCFTVTCGGGSWPGEVSWNLHDGSGTSILTGGAPYSGSFGTCTYGCTDPASIDYDPTADLDDGSCTYPCIDSDSTSSFESLTFEMFEQDQSDNFDWSITSLTTPSSLTGPSSAFDGTYYAFIETSSPRLTGDVANLVITCVDPTAWSNAALVFAYHMYGSTMGTLNVDVSDDDGATWTNVWSLSGDQGDQWYEASIDLGSYSTQIDIRFQGIRGSNYYSDMAIDYVRLMELPINGCTDTNATNYDPSATFDDGSCTYVTGCTNPLADNYDPLAYLNDGSCTYAGCIPLTLTMNDSYGDGWNGNTFTITDSSGWTYLSATITSGSFGTDSVCLSPNICYIVTCGGGSWPSEVSWTLTSDLTGGVILSGGAPYSVGLCSWPSGCMDPLASNYDSLALVDDGSCLYATTFNVDMACEPAGSFTSVNLESPLFGWCGGCVPLTDPDGDEVWSVTVDLAAGPFEYKYAVDGWTGQEDLVDDMLAGASCAPVTDYANYANRLITVAPGYVTSDTYGSCDDCELGCTDPLAVNYDSTSTTDDGSCLYSATFNVDMTCVDPSTYSTVHLESPFFGCFTGCVQMTDPDGDKVYSVTVDLPIGANTYLYSVDYNSSQENLIDDMINGGTCAPITDYFSYANREIVITNGSNNASDTYGSCDACIPGCTDSLANNYDPLAEFDDGSYCEYDVTFVVDMTCYAGTFTQLAATGPADNWSGNTYLLSDPDGDNVWEGTYSVTNNFVYMYVLDTWADSEFSGLFNEMLNGTNSCAPYTDNLSYAYRLAASPSTTSDTYGQCAPCLQGCTDALASNFDANAQIDDGSCLYATTFNVDMNCETVGSFTSVNLESPLFGWCGGCVPLTDADGDGIWSVTIDLALGNFEYKYAVDGWTGQEDLVDDMQNGGTCAPVTDYFSYANRLLNVTPGTSTNDTYGSCDPCLTVYGCTDAGATNYNSLATDDDGSCLYSTTFNVDMNCEPAGSFGYVHLESPSFGWCGGCVPMSDPDGDGVHSVTVDLPAGNFEYKYAVDGWAGQEDLIDDMQNGASCAPVTDYWSYANRLIDINAENASPELINNGDFSLTTNWGYVGGFANINQAADLWHQSGVSRLNYTDGFVFVVGNTYRITLDATVSSGEVFLAGASNRVLTIDSTGSYSYVFVADRTDLSFTCNTNYLSNLVLDNISVVELTYSNSIITSDTYGSCSECILGCTDSLAFNYNDSAMVDDGSCLYGYNCPAPYPIGLSSSDIYAEMATVHWADANSGSCRVWKYFVRYRPVGDTAWITKAAGVGSGLCNVGLPNTSKVLRNLMPSTTYEFKMKAFYCGGGESNYSYTDQFTTAPACPPMTNLAVQTFGGNHFKARFTWDTTGVYTFARIALRENTPGSSWQTAGGFGINFPVFQVMKFGLNSGTEYRAQGRTFCDPVVTSYRSDWTAPIVWTQPGVAPIRLDGGNAINNLEVYPNPSKDIFNVSFMSEDMQNLEIRVLNLIGEVIYTEGLEQFVGEYTKSINMSKYTKGVYFLEITTSNGVVNKKIVLQ